MTLSPGAKLGPYEIAAPLGAGGMGEVHRARDTRLGREVAIKALPAAFAQDPERLARFEREARLLASLSHPNIAGIHGLEEAGGHRFLVLEYVEGETLAARLARGALAVDEAVEVCRQVAAAVEAAHESGVVHRDLKPGNVMLTPAGTVKVLDFGLARGGGAGGGTGATDLSASPTMTYAATAAGVILGTAAYMSPEQARGRSVDRRTDIWSFGCVLYECLTGRRAFEGETVSDLIARILEREPDLAALPAGVPPRVTELLQRCLVKDARSRLRDIGDARIALEEALAARTPSGRLARSGTLSPGATGAGAAPARRAPPFAWAAGGLVAGALAVGAAWLALGPRGGGEGAARAVATEIVVPDEIAQPFGMALSFDGAYVVVSGFDPDAPAGGTPRPRTYVRRLDAFAFERAPALDDAFGVMPARDGRDLLAILPESPGSSEFKMVRLPQDGSGPAIKLADMGLDWRGIAELADGRFVLGLGDSAFAVMPRSGGDLPPAVRLDAGRPGVLRYDVSFGPTDLERGFLVSVVSYVNRAFRFSVGVADERTGKVKVLVEDGGQARFVAPDLLAFTRGDVLYAGRFDPARLEVRGEPVPVWSGLLSPGGFAPAFFQISRRGDLLYLPGAAGGERQVASIARDGTVTPRFTETRNVRSFELSADGRRIVFGVTNQRGIDELWVSDAEHRDIRQLETDQGADCNQPRWSPDATRIAYRRVGEDGQDGIYVQNADGTGKERVLAEEGGASYRPAGWRPDGQTLLVQRTVAGVNDLLLLPLAPGAAREAREIPGGAKGRANARVSPDGRLVTFWSDETRREAVFVAELTPDGRFGRRTQVTPASPTLPRWGPDGRTVYVPDDRGRILASTITVGDELRASPPVEVWDMQKLRFGMWHVQPDGSLLAGMLRRGEGEARVHHLVTNFAAEARRKLAEAARQ